ncbi:hypothetical protein KP509_24G006200 [Ceratopteris richardii]|nr:hypothetical protein KP509_24G006200 [Ceratopteris richardii]
MNDIRFLPMQSPPPSGLFCFVASRFTAVSPTWKEATPPKDMESSTYVDIPDDLDTTSIGLSILHRFGKVKMNMINKVLDKMMGYLSMDDGIVQVYFDIERPRIDPVAIANVLYLFHLAGRGHEVERSERFLEQVLLHRAYEDGTIYYNLPESFLLHVARLVNKFPDHFGDNGMKSLLQKRLSEHLAALLTDTESTLYAISLAMCMRACLLCDVEGSEHHILMKEARRRLVGLQRQDGSWDCDPYYRYGSNSRSWIGNEGLTTAYALLALDPHLGSQDCRVDKE